MFEQAVADFCWHAREVVSSAMGLWGWPWGRRGPSGFGSASTAEEVTAGVDASNLTAIVTGATNGIGKETARVLALRGAKVIIPARTLESGLKVKESLAEQVPSSKLHVMEMDLSSLSSVRDFARHGRIQREYPTLESWLRHCRRSGVSDGAGASSKVNERGGLGRFIGLGHTPMKDGTDVGWYNILVYVIYTK